LLCRAQNRKNSRLKLASCVEKTGGAVTAMTSDYMRIDVLGVGEAFDPNFANSSVVVTAADFRC